MIANARDYLPCPKADHISEHPRGFPEEVSDSANSPQMLILLTWL